MARRPIDYQALYVGAVGALRAIVAAQAEFFTAVDQAVREVRDADEAAHRAAEADTDTGQTECRCPAGEADCAGCYDTATETDTAEAPRLRQWFDPPEAEAVRPCGHSADYTGADCRNGPVDDKPDRHSGCCTHGGDWCGR